MTIINELVNELKSFMEKDHNKHLNRFNQSIDKYKILTSKTFKEMIDPQLFAIILYLNYLSFSAEAYMNDTLVKPADNLDIIDPNIMKELNKSSKEGLVCQYTSLIGKLVSQAIGLDNIDFYQGIVKFDTETIVSYFLPQLKSNYHSFLTHNGYIVDPTAHQFDYMVRVPFVIYEIPDGMIYFGAKETKDSLYKIFRYHTQMDINKWVVMHIDQMNKLTKTGKLQDMFMKLKEQM